MELLIGIACIGATVYYFYLMANFFDIKIAMKQKEREEQIRCNFKCTNLGGEDESGIQQIY
jgi:hypothetical protein